MLRALLARSQVAAAMSAFLTFLVFFQLSMSFVRRRGRREYLKPRGPTTLGPGLPRDDLRPLDIKTAYRKEPQPLACKSGTRTPDGRCIFGLYTLRGGDVEVMLSDHLAGAVYRMTYRDIDFVNPVAIVGASLQTAIVYDAWGTQNPTEAGVKTDSFTTASSSRMLDLRADEDAKRPSVYTSVQAANFVPPGELWGRSNKVTGNKTVMSDTRIAKRIDFLGDNALRYTVGITVPRGHWYALPEVLCSWVPIASADTFQVLRSSTGAWVEIPDKPGVHGDDLFYVQHVGSKWPAHGGFVTATADGEAAMGLQLVDFPRGFESPRYGAPESHPTWRKWSITHRLGDPRDSSFVLPPGEYTWVVNIVFGTLKSVQARLAAAAKSFDR